MKYILHKPLPAMAMHASVFTDKRPYSHMLTSPTASISRRRRNAAIYHQQKNPVNISTHLTISQWRNLMAALRPLIGESAALAVFQRCLSLSATAYSWLSSEQSSIDPLANLQHQLLTKPCTITVAAQQTLWHNSCLLLTKLFGQKLTHQLLQKSATVKLIDNKTFTNPNLVNNSLTTSH
ncbi:hypothetical protein tinsulaeT_28110 [Thalassotalea insulae]|uniref:Uncharacterized protein n=1 Tax=Thalassotalea insulae TaxID=2056778 RepID=A0ABQ6GXX0_9GAMM|nr:hypothetical protein [Thalassotalea insulae]GLX79471.1 hypothetical protein tinsulaeT_28110 [Thalassotalea insulae]